MNTEKENVPVNNSADTVGDSVQGSQQSGVFTTLDQFAAHVAKWHKIGMLQTEHFVQIPDGFEAEYQEDDGSITKIELTGDVLKGFRMGLLTGMDAFRVLPFTYSVDEPTDGSEPTPTSNE